MAKMTKGVLARDGDEDSNVIFFPNADKKAIRKNHSTKRWYNEKRIGVKPYHEWPPIKWKAEYDLPMPRKGMAFEAEIEL